MADGAQENGVEFLELFDRTVGQDLAGALVALTSKNDVELIAMVRRGLPGSWVPSRSSA
jgi:hypothetical protein